ncbi:multidrug effflux MFS transporter [Cohnella cholangitidis]|uniref:Bcr/CflA family efflux transporter n=1 Tax=Cohnella cholangitidis TaxID=2598458 RepID=A0A7G5C0N0_9BACL|nr:multidrug effflux MFS transporter [Cohnella cholangitidis]QMV42764.1 multidrug effflux MFS transporter [Cohnella cholangitidis]
MNRHHDQLALGAKETKKTNMLWLVVLLGSLSAFGPLSLDLYLPALPTLADNLNTTSSYAQLSLTACMIGLSVGQLFAGALSDFRGRRMPLQIGLLIYAVSSVLCVFSPSIEVLVLLRFVQGMAGSAGIVISRAVVKDLYSGPELTKFFALLMLVNGAAPIFSPVIGGQLLKVTPWEGLFIVLAGWGVVTLLAVLFGLPETLPVNKRMSGGIRETLTTFRRLLSDRMFMGYALAQALVSAAMFAYIAGSPFVLQNIYGVSPQMFSLFFAVNGVGIIIAGQITGALAGRIDEKKLFLSGLIIASVSGSLLLAMIGSSAGLAALLVPLFFVVSSVGIVSTTGFSLAMRNQGHAAGSASALLGLLSFLLGGVLAPIVGIAGSANALPMGIIIAVTDLGAILCYVVMVRRWEIARK